MNARERSRIETRKRLLEVGAELFFEKGVAGTRASDIAREAGVAVGTLYLHFKDKQGLLRAVLFEGVGELQESLRQFAENPPGDLAGAVRLHTEILVHFAESRPGLCRILFDPESVRTQVNTDINELLVSMLEKRLREGIEQRMFPDDLDPVVASHAVVGMIVQVLDWWTRNPDKAARETVIETLTRLRLSGLYREKG